MASRHAHSVRPPVPEPPHPQGWTHAQTRQEIADLLSSLAPAELGYSTSEGSKSKQWNYITDCHLTTEHTSFPFQHKPFPKETCLAKFSTKKVYFGTKLSANKQFLYIKKKLVWAPPVRQPSSWVWQRRNWRGSMRSMCLAVGTANYMEAHRLHLYFLLSFPL